VFSVNIVFGFKARHPSYESTDGDTKGLREFLNSLIDPTARKALVSSSGWKKIDPIGRSLFLFLVKDELFWGLLDGPALHDALNWVVPARSEWVLNDPRFRAVMEKIGGSPVYSSTSFAASFRKHLQALFGAGQNALTGPSLRPQAVKLPLPFPASILSAPLKLTQIHPVHGEFAIFAIIQPVGAGRPSL
jgi:hypothetical protein